MEPSMSNGGGEVKKEDDNEEVSVKDQEASSSCKRRFNSVEDSVGSGVVFGGGGGGGGGGGDGGSGGGGGGDSDDGVVESMSVNPEGRATSRPKSRPAPDCFVTTEFVKVGTNDQSDQIKRVIGNVDAYPKIFDDAEKSSKAETVTARMPVAKDADRYFMHHKNRGKCVIFNHEESVEFGKRLGSTVDAKNLQKSFSTLGFDVNIHNNLTHREVMEVLEELSTKTDHSDSDCICIIVLTHGMEHDLICAKDAFYRVNRLWEPFADDNCPTLAGKPKLFFVQACRGGNFDDGVVLAAHNQSVSSTDSISPYKIPTYTDILIAHSSLQGFYAWRNHEYGTWYVECLCSVLNKYGTELDLLTMLTMTARVVATEYKSYNPQDAILHEKKQIPSLLSMLIRSVYFPPKMNV